MPLCGHGTLAAAHVLAEQGGPGGDKVFIAGQAITVLKGNLVFPDHGI